MTTEYSGLHFRKKVVRKRRAVYAGMCSPVFTYLCAMSGNVYFVIFGKI